MFDFVPVTSCPQYPHGGDRRKHGGCRGGGGGGGEGRQLCTALISQLGNGS